MRKDGRRTGVQVREKRRKGKAEQEQSEIKRMREESVPKVGGNMRLKGDGWREVKGLVAP